jgi:hypothetical protein
MLGGMMAKAALFCGDPNTIGEVIAEYIVDTDL